MIVANFKCPHWAFRNVWFIFVTIKVSDILRAQLNCLWSVINYGSDGKWQDNKYLLFYQDEKYIIHPLEEQSSYPRQGSPAEQDLHTWGDGRLDLGDPGHQKLARPPRSAQRRSVTPAPAPAPAQHFCHLQGAAQAGRVVLGMAEELGTTWCCTCGRTEATSGSLVTAQPWRVLTLPMVSGWRSFPGWHKVFSQDEGRD